MLITVSPHLFRRRFKGRFRGRFVNFHIFTFPETMTTSDGNKATDTAFGVNQNGSTVTNTTNPPKKQTTRKVFSHAAQLELENAFRMSPYLTAWKRQCLSQKLNLTERQVRVWFQNRRMHIRSERGRCRFQGVK